MSRLRRLLRPSTPPAAEGPGAAAPSVVPVAAPILPPGLALRLGVPADVAGRFLGDHRPWQVREVSELSDEAEQPEVVLVADSAASLRRVAAAALPVRSRTLTIALAGTDRAGRLQVPVRVGDVPVVAAGLSQASEVGPAVLTVRTEQAVRLDALCQVALSGSVRPQVDEPAAVPVVDTAVISPRGFRADATAGDAELTVDGSSFVVHRDGRQICRGDLRVGVTENHLAALRPARALHIALDLTTAPADAARLLAQLACAGVPTLAPVLPAPVAGALGADVTAGLVAASAALFADPARRADWSVAIRRAALYRFAPPVSVPEVSVLVPTNRPGFLSFALGQVQRQDWPVVQTVLILHGHSAAEPSVAAAIQRYSRPLEVVEVDRAASFGEALNAGLRRCTGAIVSKMDDDDWYGPHHLTDLVQARAHSGAALAALASYWIYLRESATTVHRTGDTEDYVTAVHGGTMLIGREELLALGGWRATARGEDTHLQAAVAAAGLRMYGIHDLGFLYYRGHDHTWAVAEQHWLGDDRWRRTPGFAPPSQLEPLPHPGMAAHG